ncbi:DUF1289 domain-containing protein [Xanthobacter autotrophicus]|uniref:DUF1289 domain-containing protein n=1 Tax=Xanthobacter autotrophicus TaxID=280 RepID=UPI00372D7CA8
MTLTPPGQTPDADAIATPCVKLCAIEPLSGLCLGCGRSLREIGAWMSYSPATRAAIMAALPQRLARVKAEVRDSAPD